MKFLAFFQGEKLSTIRFLFFHPNPSAPNKMIESYSDSKWEEIEGFGPLTIDQLFIQRTQTCPVFLEEGRYFPPNWLKHRGNHPIVLPAFIYGIILPSYHPDTQITWNMNYRFSARQNFPVLHLRLTPQRNLSSSPLHMIIVAWQVGKVCEGSYISRSLSSIHQTLSRPQLDLSPEIM